MRTIVRALSLSFLAAPAGYRREASVHLRLSGTESMFVCILQPRLPQTDPFTGFRWQVLMAIGALQAGELQRLLNQDRLK
jgi:hypothetical protein